MYIVFKHLALLAEHVKGGVENILPVRCKEFLTALVVNKDIYYAPKVFVKTVQHEGLGVLYKFTAFLLHLYQIEIYTAGVFIT